MRYRAVAAWAFAGVLAGSALAGCTPSPEPSPSPTGWASEEEAFAAAEETYRAYVDAVNARRAEEDAEPDPASFLTGQALELDIETQRALSEAGLRLEGPTSVTSVESLERSTTSVRLHVCMDASQSKVIDSSGTDVTPTSRPPTMAIEARILWTPQGTLVSESNSSDRSC